MGLEPLLKDWPRPTGESWMRSVNIANSDIDGIFFAVRSECVCGLYVQTQTLRVILLHTHTHTHTHTFT